MTASARAFVIGPAFLWRSFGAKLQRWAGKSRPDRAEDAMHFTKTSITALVALGFVAGTVGSAAACDWHKQQVHANASTPASEAQAETSATPIDPVLLARSQSREESEAIQQK
jgi:hypothetical protein